MTPEQIQQLTELARSMGISPEAQGFEQQFADIDPSGLPDTAATAAPMNIPDVSPAPRRQTGNVAQDTFDFFSDTGDYQPFQAAALGGGFGSEGRPTSIRVNDRPGSFAPHSAGIIQANDQRQLDMFSMAHGMGLIERPDPARMRDPNYVRQLLSQIPADMQREFSHAELNTTEAAAGNRIRGSRNLDEAAQAAIGYHRPAGWYLSNPTAGDNYSGRRRLAAGLMRGEIMPPDRVDPAQSEPGMQTQQPAGRGAWGQFVNDERTGAGNRAFLINMGLAMMTGGGWGGPMANLGQAMAAGFRAKDATESGAVTDERAAAEEVRRGERHESQLELADARGQNYMGRTNRPANVSPETLRQNRLMQQFLDRFAPDGADLAPGAPPPPPPSREDWERENRPGGLIPAVFGGPKPYEQAPQLLQRVQAQSQANRPLQGPRGYPTLSAEEMIGLQDSQNPADRLRFQHEMQRIQRRSPGVGNEWFITPEGNISTRPMQGVTPRGQRGAAGGTQLQQNAIAAMQSSLMRLGDVREALNNTNRFQRAISAQTGSGVFATVKPEMEIVAASIMHGLSGAQVNIPETQRYLQALVPQPTTFGELWDPGRMTQRLDHAELLLRSMLQVRGNVMPEEAILEIRNRMRAQLGQQPKTMEQHLQDLRMIGREPGPIGGPQPGQNRPGTIVTPPRPRPQQGPPALGPQPNPDLRNEYQRRYNLVP